MPGARVRAVKGLVAALLMTPFVGWAGTAGAADACVAAYEKAQEEKVDGRLRAARAQLRTCVQASCPAIVRTDCVKWLEEVEAALPTVVFIARMEGRDVMDVRVRLGDGEELAAQLDGRSVRVDPGRHSFTFVSTFAQPATVQILVAEGQKNRVVEATLVPLPLGGTAGGTPLGGADVGGVATTGGGWDWVRRNRLPLALAGVGAAGLASFVVLGAKGSDQQSRLEQTCAPSCPADDVGSVRTKYLLADVSLGVSVGAMAVAAYLFYRESARSPGDSAAAGRRGLSWSVAAAAGSAAVVVGSSF